MLTVLFKKKKIVFYHEDVAAAAATSCNIFMKQTFHDRNISEAV